MNILTLLHNIRDAVAEDSETKAWCQINYNRNHNVYLGVDVRKPPTETNYPLVHIFPIGKRAGYGLDAQEHMIGITCGIYDADTETTTEDNIIELQSIGKLEEFRKLVETAVAGADLITGTIEEISIEYETVEFFPFLLTTQEFKIDSEYYQGGDVFE